jgi:hypothetical protein
MVYAPLNTPRLALNIAATEERVAVWPILANFPAPG